MKLKIIDTKNAEKGAKDLPAIFAESYRPDLIKRSVEALQANARQPYGTDLHAGMRCIAKISRRRRDYKASYGHGIARTPRKILSRSGARMNWVGAFAPNAVGGRRAHPPKAHKILEKKMNKKENQKAIRSAIAATMSKDLVKQRGHVLPEAYPFIITDDFEKLAKTKQVEEVLIKLGFTDELTRASERTLKSGRARMRGRKYRKRKGPLFVVSKDCPLLKAAVSLPGVEAVTVTQLNAELLAPGASPARLTLFTESAIERINKEKLFQERIAKQ